MEVMYERVAGLDVHKATVVACVRLGTDRKITRECRTDDGRLADFVGVVGGMSLQPRGDGGYRGLLDAGVEDSGRRKLRPDRRQCGAHQERSRPQDRSERCDVDCRPSGLRVDQAKLRSGRGGAGTAFAAAHPQATGARADAACAADPEDARRSQHQTGLGALRYHGCQRLTDHHRFLLTLHLRQWDNLDATIREIDREVEARIARMDKEVKAGEAPFRDLIGLLCTIPGVSTLSATTILSEIGRAMSRFPTAGHLVAWAGLCPGQNESAGKRKPVRLRKGAPWLKTMLVQCAWAAKRKKDSYYKAQFFRLQARRGPQKAICAVAASILTAIYHILKNGTEHHDLGADHFNRRSTEAQTKRLVAQLTRLGFEVQLQRTAEAA